MALAASSLLTVTRTTSLPARARAATCLMVPGISAVSVLVMDCTITGALLPTRTPAMLAVEVFLRLICAMFTVYFKPARQKARITGGLRRPRLEDGVKHCVNPSRNARANLIINQLADKGPST